MASTWVTVPSRFRCKGGEITKPFRIPRSGVLQLTIDTDACDGLPNHVRYLEHVQVGNGSGSDVCVCVCARNCTCINK